MAQIRVLLFDMNGIAADIVRHVLAPHDDIEILVGDGAEAAVDVDLVIARHGGDPVPLNRLLATRPGLSALTVRDEGRSAVLYRLLPETTEFGPLSPDSLVDFVRRSVR